MFSFGFVLSNLVGFRFAYNYIYVSIYINIIKSITFKTHTNIVKLCSLQICTSNIYKDFGLSINYIITGSSRAITLVTFL